MALTVSANRIKSVSFISKMDDAVEKALSDRKAYDENPVKNADKLVFKPGKEPTVFVLNLDLTSKELSKIKDSMIKGFDKESNMPVISMGAWSHAVCRIILKDIQHPKGTVNPLVEFRKDASGYVKEDVLDILAKYGIVEEIFACYNLMTAEDQEVLSNSKN